MCGSELGIIVVDSSGPIASNPEAIRILCFPSDPNLNGNGVTARIRALIAPELLTGAVDSKRGEIISGNRKYLWLAERLDHAPLGGAAQALLMLRRPWHMAADLHLIANEYGLTRRERECVGYVLLGLSNKAIAQRMKISSSTVNTFMHIIMVKLGASSRCNILLKVCGLQEHRDRPANTISA